MFRFYNANAKDLFVDDCTIRAISLAEDRTWNETYYKLSNLARKKGMMMDSVQFIEEYLDERYERVREREAMSVGDFARKHTMGTYLITMPNHISIIMVGGFIVDTFDCSNRIMQDAWRVV